MLQEPNETLLLYAQNKQAELLNTVSSSLAKGFDTLHSTMHINQGCMGNEVYREPLASKDDHVSKHDKVLCTQIDL